MMVVAVVMNMVIGSFVDVKDMVVVEVLDLVEG